MSRKIDFSSKDISGRMVSRLTEYLRILKELSKTTENINSVELATKMNSTAAQVRKDLSTFGEFGTRGKGYSIRELIGIIESILGIDHQNDLILIGYGKMGSMLASNTIVLGKSFHITNVFDKSEEKVGKKIENLDLYVKSTKELKKIIHDENIIQVILAVNSEHAQEVTNELVEYGVKGILNLTAFQIEVPTDVVVVDVDISAKLQELNFWRRKKHLKNVD